MSAPRIGLIGARRRNQGLGPFVARDLVRAGARVAAFTTTRPETRDAAARQLAEDCAIEARGYLDARSMLAREQLDAVAILSPAETHAEHLELALAAGVHVLCEKPLLWGRPDLGAATGRIVRDFESAGCELWENCQWPYTLGAYEALFPGALRRPPRRFEMDLQPATVGLRACADSLPHVLSLLQALVPGREPRLEALRFSEAPTAATEGALDFRYRTDAWALPVAVRLRPTETSPRDARYALDGRGAHRRVSGGDYRLSFADDGGREVPLPDPLTRLVGDFVAALRAGTRPRRDERIAERGILMEQLQHEFESAGAWGTEA